MLNVCCVYWGDAFSKDYVFILQDMVRRNLAEGFRGQFVVFTDNPDAFQGAPGIVTRSLPTGVSGWWNKLYLFDNTVFPKGDRVLYFDLDTVITGPLDKIAEYSGDFAILEDPWRPGGFNSSVMAWEAGGSVQSIYREWLAAGKPEILGGDQAFIEQSHPKAESLQSLFPGRFKSFKAHGCAEGIPQGTSVVYFHGKPRPHEVTSGWVPEVWRIGGGSEAELVMIGTVAQDIVLANMRDALSHGYKYAKRLEPHPGIAIICGGGPSLKDQLSLIGNLSAGGATVFAVNGVAKHLISRNIMPDYHVMVDARPEMAEMVVSGPTQLFASMMDPAVLASADDLVCWHPLTDGAKEVAGRTVYVGGGTTVGTKAIVLAYMLGFRNLFLVGFDSSYSDDGSHHAYTQPLNDRDRILDVRCGGRDFKAAPWHVKQSEDLKSLFAALRAECQFTVAGDGLWPHMFSILANAVPAYEIRSAEILRHIAHVNKPVGAEIGVFAGELSGSLLRNREDLTLYMVDHWKELPQRGTEKADDFHKELSQLQQDAYYQRALATTDFARDRTKVIRGDSALSADKVPDASLDFVFIDADHSYEGCRRDILAWMPKVKPGGIIAGHDYENENFPTWGVKRAVDEIFRSPEIGDNYTWFVINEPQNVYKSGDSSATCTGQVRIN